MKQLIIVGSGGLAKELYGYISQDISKGFLQNLEIKGFLDSSRSIFESSGINSVYLGSETEYSVNAEDVFLVAIGTPLIREKIFKKMQGMGVEFFSYVHSTSFVDESAKLGKGVIICPFSMVNGQAEIGDFTLMNIYSSVAHDSKVGKNSILSPYSTLNGEVIAGKGLFMGTRATILPKVCIGNDCTLSAGVVVSKSMPDNSLAYPKSRALYKQL